jgi:hypothetical protein
MRTPTNIRRQSDRKIARHNSELDPTEVVPFGRYGAGLFTGHPVGLVVVIGLLLMGLFGIAGSALVFRKSASSG